MGKGRNMEETKRTGTESDSPEVRGEGLPSESDSPPGEEGVSRRAALAVQSALELMSERDRAIFHAGILYGSAKQMGDMGEQHRRNWNALNRTANATLAQCVNALEPIPVDASKRPAPKAKQRGEAAGKRLRKALGVLLGLD